MKLNKVYDSLLAVGAATRLTRFVVEEDLAEWGIHEPAQRWARSPRWGVNNEARERLIHGLDCQFCVGTWLHLGTLAINALLPDRGRARGAYRVVTGALSASYVMAQVGSKLDEDD